MCRITRLLFASLLALHAGSACALQVRFDLPTARAQTRDHLSALPQQAVQAVKNGTDIEEAVRSFNGSAFGHLRLASDLAGRNMSRAYLEVERA